MEEDDTGAYAYLLGVRSFQENMLSLPLDGTGDEKGSEECRRYWHDLQMPAWRAQILAEVEASWNAGEIPLTFESYQKLMQPFPARGFLDELVHGQDDEGTTVQEPYGRRDRKSVV